jgi:hypothetical protein
MGFQTTRRTGGGKIYAHMSDGNIVVPASEGESVGEIEAESRENKYGKVVWELHFPSFTGHLVSAEIREHEEFGDKLVLKMLDKTASKKDPYREIYLDMQLSSDYAKRFFMRMENMDLSGPIGVMPYHVEHDKKPGKFRNGCNFYAGEISKDTKIEEAIDRDDVPEMVQIKHKGKLTWDDTDQLEFLKEKFEEWKQTAFPEDDSDGADDSDQEEDEDEPPHPAKKAANAKAAGKAVLESKKSKPATKPKKKAKVEEEDDEDEDEDDEEDF